MCRQPLIAPAGLSVPSLVADGVPVVVTWSAIINATSYKLQKTLEKNSTGMTRFNGPKTNSGTFSLEYSLNSMFLYAVQVCNDEGCSAWSSQVAAYVNRRKIEAIPATGSTVP